MIKFFKRLLGLYPLPKVNLNNTVFGDFLKPTRYKLVKPEYGPLKAPGSKNLHMRNYLSAVALYKTFQDTDVLLDSLGMTFSGDMVYTSYKYEDDTVTGELQNLQKGIIPVLYATLETDYSSTLLEMFQKIKPDTLNPIQKLVVDTMIKQENIILINDYNVPDELNLNVFNNKNLTGDNQYDLMLLYISYKLFKNHKIIRKIKKLLSNILLDNDSHELYPAIIGYQIGVYDKSDLELFIAHHLTNTHRRDRFNNTIPFMLFKELVNFV